MGSYQEPSWAVLPTTEEGQDWFLVEIKGGVEVGKHSLGGRKCTVLGRATNMVHVPIHHESASRQHARIAFDQQGIPWLRDLGSTHGTTCNKKRLPSQAIGRQESSSQQAGARGVMLFPGDILQFGASTRVFCLEGPYSFERGALQARLEQQKLEQASTVAPIKMLEGDEGVSWGIATDDIDSSEGITDMDSEPRKEVPMDADVPEKHRRMLERLNIMKYKLGNLESEDDKIRRKGELSEGQERQLQRNAEREETLKKSIVELESELYDKLHPEKSQHNRTRQGARSDKLDEDDDFFDRTKSRNDQIIGDNESESSLVSKWKQIQRNYLQQEDALHRAQQRIDNLQAKHNKLHAQGDEEEAFFLQNDLNLARETYSNLKDQGETQTRQLEEIEQLLVVVNDKIQVDRASGYIGVGPPPSRSAEEPTIASAAETDNASDFSTMLPPPPMPPPSQVAVSSELPPPMPKPTEREPPKESTSTVLPMPPPKRPRVVGPNMPPPSLPSSKKHASTIQGTLSFLKPASKGASQPAPKAKGPPTLQDSKKDEWKAPPDQDGSGITKLNAKFAGRY
eukprot:Nitzschia sp. Nitz4//scaffold55_size114948//73373//75076//NITZ4_003909-RA/size114948-processed-gene-0.213-mRNA-1//1//CDS//3329554554//6452//frame0